MKGMESFCLARLTRLASWSAAMWPGNSGVGNLGSRVSLGGGSVHILHMVTLLIFCCKQRCWKYWWWLRKNKIWWIVQLILGITVRFTSATDSFSLKTKSIQFVREFDLSIMMIKPTFVNGFLLGSELKNMYTFQKITLFNYNILLVWYYGKLLTPPQRKLPSLKLWKLLFSDIKSLNI